LTETEQVRFFAKQLLAFGCQQFEFQRPSFVLVGSKLLVFLDVETKLFLLD